jgi:hypothetical protein
MSIELEGITAGKRVMIDSADKRGEIIRALEDALAAADATAYLIERALDEARSRPFRPTAR